MTNDTTYILPMPCLGAFGGPVDPNLAMGGFNSKFVALIVAASSY